ncbi:MAG: hypothetical protein NG740_07235 [Omnitrophica bacterium]|nr:hypothetical protein [Candidatus Omnitrophota bacterium]
MDITERNAKLSGFFKECVKLLESKGKDYNPTGVAFDDLQEAAKDIGRGPVQVLWVYMGKHIAAVRSFVKNGAVASEPIEKRLMDLANYCGMMCVLLESLKHEKKEKG